MADKWKQLSTRQQRGLGVAAVLELGLKIAALVDIQRRPAEQIRGPKLAWRLAMFVNLFGPVAYFVIGRRG
jgi:Phospholipase_D-nuclease N-terminal